eukprot:1159972-Pelagomonas_calceolata.AAC.1
MAEAHRNGEVCHRMCAPAKSSCKSNHLTDMVAQQIQLKQGRLPAMLKRAIACAPANSSCWKNHPTGTIAQNMSSYKMAEAHRSAEVCHHMRAPAKSSCKSSHPTGMVAHQIQLNQGRDCLQCWGAPSHVHSWKQQPQTKSLDRFDCMLGDKRKTACSAGVRHRMRPCEQQLQARSPKTGTTAQTVQCTGALM